MSAIHFSENGSANVRKRIDSCYKVNDFNILDTTDSYLHCTSATILGFG